MKVFFFSAIVYSVSVHLMQSVYLAWRDGRLTVGDKEFPVAAARLWDSLPSHVTAAPFLCIVCCRLKSHLFSLSYPAFWLFSHLYSAHAV